MSRRRYRPPDAPQTGPTLNTDPDNLGGWCTLGQHWVLEAECYPGLNSWCINCNREYQRQYRMKAKKVTPHPAIMPGFEHLARSTNGHPFGMEIEHYNTGRYEVAQALKHKGLKALYYDDIIHTKKVEWRTVPDSTIHGDQPAELLSPGLPPLSGLEGFRQMDVVFETLNEMGGQVNTSCGFHVHMDARGLSQNAIRAAAGFYAVNQSWFDMLVARSRRGGNSATHGGARMENSELRHLDQIGRNGYYIDSFNWDRYCTVNLAAYSRHGTIEFRQHQGTLNATKAKTWVKLLLAVVEFGVRRQDVGSLWDLERGNLREVLKDLRLHSLDRDYLLRRAEVLAS